MVGNAGEGGKQQSNVLYAFYDLAVSPATFDIIKFLVLAERERTEVGCEAMHVVIVPGPDEGFRRDNFTPYSTESKQWRLRNVLVPCCWLVPSCQQVTVCTSRKEATAFQASLAKHVFPRDYVVRSPIANYSNLHIVNVKALPTIQSTPTARRFVRDWIQARADARKVISITLRESTYEQDRNSSLKDWGEFANSLDPTYCPVFVRDIETALNPLPAELRGFLVFPEVVWNIELRAAFYELSYLSMFVNSGPAALCMFNRQACSLTFKMITPTAGATTEQFFRSQGIQPGSQLKGLSPFNRLVWEDDRIEVILEAFHDMCNRIEIASLHEEETEHLFEKRG